MVNFTMSEESQSKIVETRRSYTFEGGQITLAPPASGKLANNEIWKHDYKIELVFGKTIVPIKTKAMYDSLLENLSKPKVKEFANKLPSMSDSSELD